MNLKVITEVEDPVQCCGLEQPAMVSEMEFCMGSYVELFYMHKLEYSYTNNPALYILHYYCAF